MVIAYVLAIFTEYISAEHFYQSDDMEFEWKMMQFKASVNKCLACEYEFNLMIQN